MDEYMEAMRTDDVNRVVSMLTADVVRVADTTDGYARWPDRAADPRQVESVFRRFGLPDHID